MQNPQSYTSKGRMVYQYETIGHENAVIVTRLVQQPDGAFWKYHFYKGRNVGTPQRAKNLQAYFLETIAAIVAAINA